MKRMLIALLALMLLTAACTSAPISAQPTAPQVATVPVIATATSMPAPTASEIPPTATNEPATATPEPPTPTTNAGDTYHRSGHRNHRADRGSSDSSAHLTAGSADG